MKIVLKLVLSVLMMLVMKIRREDHHYLSVPNEILSWIKSDRIMTLGHAIPSVVVAIIFAVKLLPLVSTTYAVQLENNGQIIPMTIIAVLIPLLILNGILIESILTRTNSVYRNHKKPVVYQQRSIDELLSLEDETSIIIGIGQMLSNKLKDNKDFESLNEFEKNVLFIEMLEGEVNNGGFHQYFFNSSGDYAHETLRAMEEINAPKMGRILNQAIQLFPLSSIPKDEETRREIMYELPESLMDKWNSLDDAFYKYPENIGGLVIEYVKRNQDQFE